MKNRFDAAVIGSKGFIGSNVVGALKTKNISVFEIQRKMPLDDMVNRSFGTVFFCAGNSKTFISKSDPLRCLRENIFDLYDYLTRLDFSKFVYISSVIVYPQTGCLRTEDLPIDISDLSIYGAHKYLAERYVREFAKSWLIVRPTGFFGKGLKKNLLFDLRNDNPHIYVNRSSWIDYMPVDWFCDNLYILSEKAEGEIINVGSGHALSVEMLLSLKNLEYRLHEERLQDDRNISFQKLYQYIPHSLNHTQLENMIKEYIQSKV
jgi:nucleoside-diphosphate-sugar epimerase